MFGLFSAIFDSHAWCLFFQTPFEQMFSMSVKERKVRAAKCPQLTIFIQCFIYPCPTNEVRKGSIPTLRTHNPFRHFVVREKLMDCLVYKK